jgi:23S rRNA pseudouridine2604 synthase
LTFNGKLLPPAKVSWQSEARLRFALKGELPGQIAYFCESVGLRITAMKRLRIGRVAMSGLQVGHWRYLLPNERF